MKKVFAWILGAAVALTSCTNEEKPTLQMPHAGTFTATFTTDSRTVLDGTSILWETDDLLSVFSVTSHNRKYTISNLSEDRRTASFTESGEYSGDDWTVPFANVALFPLHTDARLNGSVLTTYTATEQTYASDKIGLDHSLMVAHSTDHNFAFKNAGAVMRFIIKKAEGLADNYTLQSIRLSSVSQPLAGEVIIDLSTDNKAIVAADGVKELSLVGINTPITTEEQSFHLAIPAVAFPTDDLTFTFIFDECTKTIPMTNSFEVLQNTIRTVRYTISAEDFTGTTPDFEDEQE